MCMKKNLFLVNKGKMNQLYIACEDISKVVCLYKDTVGHCYEILSIEFVGEIICEK